MHKPQPGMYVCTKCNRTLDATEFYVDIRKKTGLGSWCKSCGRAKATARVLAMKLKKEGKQCKQ